MESGKGNNREKSKAFFTAEHRNKYETKVKENDANYAGRGSRNQPVAAERYRSTKSGI